MNRMRARGEAGRGGEAGLRLPSGAAEGNLTTFVLTAARFSICAWCRAGLGLAML